MTDTKERRDPTRDAAQHAQDRADFADVGTHLEAQRQLRIQADAARAVLQPLWDRLAAPFPDDEVEKLPKTLRRDDNDKGDCRQGSRYSADGFHCGGYHARAIHLDYVGHAGITMRLNDVAGPANWELRPLGWSDQGLPAYNRDHFWVALTILGTTKIDVAENYRTIQEAWGDGLRRAASRFGIGTYLWSKSDRALALRQADPTPPPDRTSEAMAFYNRALATTDVTEVGQVWREASAAGVLDVQVDELDGSRETLRAAIERYGNSLRGGGA